MAQVIGIKKVPPTPVEIEYVDLRLTGDEANTLYDILCKVGGNPTESRRLFVARMFRPLREEVFPTRDCQAPNDLEGRMYFRGGAL